MNNRAQRVPLPGCLALESLVENLLPGSLVLPLKYILKLHKGVSLVEVNFFGSHLELRDGFIDGELNTKYPTVLVDLGLNLVARIIALQLVGSGSKVFSSHVSSKTKWGGFS